MKEDFTNDRRTREILATCLELSFKAYPFCNLRMSWRKCSGKARLPCPVGAGHVNTKYTKTSPFVRRRCRGLFPRGHRMRGIPLGEQFNEGGMKMMSGTPVFQRGKTGRFLEHGTQRISSFMRLRPAGCLPLDHIVPSSVRKIQ